MPLSGVLGSFDAKLPLAIDREIAAEIMTMSATPAYASRLFGLS
jgi:hypothetical protein